MLPEPGPRCLRQLRGHGSGRLDAHGAAADEGQVELPHVAERPRREDVRGERKTEGKEVRIEEGHGATQELCNHRHGQHRTCRSTC